LGFFQEERYFFPSHWEEVGFYQEETLSSGKKWEKLGINSFFWEEMGETGNKLSRDTVT